MPRIAINVTAPAKARSRPDWNSIGVAAGKNGGRFAAYGQLRGKLLPGEVWQGGKLLQAVQIFSRHILLSEMIIIYSQ